MVIRISDDVMISATDGLNYDIKVRKIKTSTTGEKTTVWKSVGYYPKLNMAAIAVLNKGLARGSHAVSVQELITHINKVEARITEVCQLAVTAGDAALVEGAFGDEEFAGLWGSDE